MNNSRGRQTGLWTVVLTLAAVLSPFWEQFCVASDSRAERALQVYQNRHRQRHQQMLQSLQSLQQKYDDPELEEAVGQVKAIPMPMEDRSIGLKPLPTKVQPPIETDVPSPERAWRRELRDIQKDYAKDVYRLARRVLDAGFPSAAYRLVREVARHNPDHRWARRILGYVRYRDEWLSPFAAKMRRQDYIWHERFGWIAEDHVQRYENGQRYFRGRWLPAAQEAEIRRDFQKAWQVRTEHFLIRTNYSLQRGVTVATKLEDFYQFFFEMFAGAFKSPEQLEKLFRGAGRNPRRRIHRRPFRVHYYRSRDEYNRRLREKIPQIEITNGLYLTQDRISYFFHDPEEDNDRTLYHEATHQFFYESVPQDRPIAQNAHFWAVEAIACYMESFQRTNGRFSIGDPRDIRFYWARRRYLQEDYYVPLAEFTQLGVEEFQNDPNLKAIQKRYSQASGLAHFLIHCQNGRYRDAFIEHLGHLYRTRGPQRGQLPSLAELTGVEFAKLDRQYGEYLKQMQRTVDGEEVVQ